MSSLEELEQRKKELQLRNEIAKLERENRVREASAKMASLRWWWVASLCPVSLFFIIGGINDEKPGAIVVGLLLLVPLLLKVLGSRSY